MRKRISISIVLFAFLLSFSIVFAEHHTAAERGKAHFNNPSFAGGKRACNACHSHGKGLENAGAKMNFSNMGGKQTSLEEVINGCIVNANKGNSLDVNSTEMQELVSYIKSLGVKALP